MAYPVVAGGAELWNGLYLRGGKRRVSYSDGSDLPLEFDDQHAAKRMRLSDVTFFDVDFNQQHAHQAPREPLPTRSLAFLVIKQRSPSPEPVPEARACSMERTASGLSISSDTTTHLTGDLFGGGDGGEQLLGDAEAAWLVAQHMASYRRRFPDSQHERILRSLIQPKSRGAEFSIDDAALESIFSAANALFFHNRLSHRVRWDWSHASSAQYEREIIGTTALRRAAVGGYETLIVLSQPILRDRKYNRRLLISTFLHELIHSYMFICCGFSARACGGHTEGFRQIARMVDDWTGPDTLHLKEMEADLERFRRADDLLLAADGTDGSCWDDPDDRRRPYHHHMHEFYPRTHEFGLSPLAHHHPVREHDHRRHQVPYGGADRWEHAVHDRWDDEIL